MRFIPQIITIAALLLAPSIARAQQLFEPDYGQTLELDVTTTSADDAFTGSGGSILVYNAHDKTVWVRTGVPGGEGPELVAAVGEDLPIPPDRQALIRLPRTHTHIAAVTAEGSGKVYVTQGTGF